jgi:hypothetical protein
MSAVQFLADSAELTLLELADLNARHRSAVRMTAAYISFSTERSPNACGMIFVRRRSSRKSRSSKFVSGMKGAVPPVSVIARAMRYGATIRNLTAHQSFRALPDHRKRPFDVPRG